MVGVEMAQKNYKVGEAIEVIYQAQNAASEVVINMETFDETHTVVAGGPIVMIELGSSGRYHASFIPDEVGEWSVQIEQDGGIGKTTKAFSVGGHNVHDVGATVETIDNNTTNLGTNLGIVEGKVDISNEKLDGLLSPPMIG